MRKHIHNLGKIKGKIGKLGEKKAVWAMAAGKEKGKIIVVSAKNIGKTPIYYGV